MKQLYLVSTYSAAHDLQCLLANNGIEAIVRGVESAPSGSSDCISSSLYTVLVHDRDFDAASDLYAQFRKNSNESNPSAGDTNQELSQEQLIGELPAPKSSARLWSELLLVLSLTQPFYSPAEQVLRSTIALLHRGTFTTYWTNQILYYCLVTGVGLAVIWLSGEPWSAFGITKPKWSVDAISGCLTLFIDRVMSYMGAETMVGILASLHVPVASHVRSRVDDLLDRPEGLLGVISLFLLTFAIGFSEELVSRAIVLTRLERLTESQLLPIVVSAAQFTAFHWHWGIVTMGRAFITGVVYGIVFKWTRRLWPVVFAHTLVDLLRLALILNVSKELA